MLRTFLRFAALSLAIVCGFTTLHAQSPIALMRPAPQSNRVPANADLGPQTQLTGHLPRWVSGGSQVAAQPVDLSANMRISIVLQRDPAVQAAFEQFLADQQTPGNALYHQWLTPQQVGTLFGPTASDVAAVTNWLTAQGLTIDQISNSQVIIDAHGSAAAVANAFRTGFAYYPLNGTPRISATSEPFVPTALTPVIDSIFGLTDIPLNPLSHLSGPHEPAVPGSAANPQPQLTSTSSGNHYLTPNDFAVVFDINSVYSGGNKGATVGSKAQRVAIIGRARVSPTDISEFITNTASSFNIANLNTVIPTGGTDPGTPCSLTNLCTNDNGDQDEQTLDVDRVIGTAPATNVDLVVATNASGGIYLAAQYNVNTLVDPVMTISYGACEFNASASSDNLWGTVFSAGAAEGVSTFVSSGDSGANGCAPAFTPTTITYTASINYICANNYSTCVGGTEFNDTASPSTYWSGTNGTGLQSVLSYIPEGGWNESSVSPYSPTGSGGGPSLYIAKPTWQTGSGVLADGKRDTPDIAYPAASHDGFYACLDYALGSAYVNAGKTCATGYFFDFSGTSAAAPSMAGVAALLNTKLGTAQGLLNPMLYTLAATPSNNVFHDVTVSTSGVTGCAITTPSMCNNSTPGSSSNSTTVAGGLQGYSVGAGYDMVTGLGSIDVANLLAAAAPTTVSTTLALTTVTPNPVAVSTSVTLTATITRSSTTAGNATGTVSFYYTPSGGSATLIGSAVAVSGNAATTTTSFSTAGTYSITAVYSGDSNYSTSTATGVPLVVTAGPSFTLAPATTTYNLISGATTGNTDVITLTSTNSFVGAVVVSCTVTNVSGNAAGTCASTTPVTLTANGTGTSTLTITTTPGTSGALSITVKGTSGSTVSTSGAITVNLTASSYTMAASPGTISIAGNATTGNTTTVTLTSVNGFAGLVTVSCASSVTAVATCSAGAPVNVPLNGTATVVVTATPVVHNSGTSTLTISGTGTTTGATVAATASTTVALTVTTVGSTTTVTATPNPVVAGSPTTLKATVTGVSVNGNPTGTVTFLAGSTTLGTGTLSTTAGVTTATYTYTPSATSASATAASITASYAGDSGYAASTSAAVPLAVQGTTATATSVPPSFTSGATTGNTATITFTSVGGYAGPVVASCTIAATSGSPANPATCAASAAANVTAGGTTTTTVTITSTTAHAGRSGPLQAGFTGWGLRGGAVLAMMLCLVPFRRRFIRSLAAFVLLACGLVAISGCGGTATPAKQSSAGTYTVTTTGTSGTATASVSFTLTIN